MQKDQIIYVITHQSKWMAGHQQEYTNIQDVIDYLANTCHVMIAQNDHETGLRFSLLMLHHNQTLMCDNGKTDTTVYVKKTTRKHAPIPHSYSLH